MFPIVKTVFVAHMIQLKQKATVKKQSYIDIRTFCLTVLLAVNLWRRQFQQ